MWRHDICHNSALQEASIPYRLPEESHRLFSKISLHIHPFYLGKSMHVHILPFVIPNARAMSIGKCLYVVVGFSVSNAYVGIVI